MHRSESLNKLNPNEQQQKPIVTRGDYNKRKNGSVLENVSM